MRSLLCFLLLGILAPFTLQRTNNLCDSAQFLTAPASGTAAATCTNCLTNCAVCSNATDCLQCAKGYAYSTTLKRCDGNLTQHCSLNSLACDGCKTCNAKTLDFCFDDLLDGFFFANNFAVTPPTITKTACKTNCSKCDSTGNKCLKCIVGNWNDPAQATTTAGYVCGDACPTNCASCEGSTVKTVCKVCKDNFFLTATGVCTACSAGCAQCTSATTCTRCSENYILSNAQCIAISANLAPNCAEANGTTSAQTCTRCALGFAPDLTTKNCTVLCPLNCLACNHSTTSTTANPDLVCKQCSSGYYPVKDSTTQKSVCRLCSLENCQVCNLNGTCRACRLGFALDTAGACRACNDNCLHCYAPGAADACHVCKQPFRLLANVSANLTAFANGAPEAFLGTCLPGECKAANIPDSAIFSNAYLRRCHVCPKGCISCSHPFLCETCKPGTYLDQSTTDKVNVLLKDAVNNIATSLVKIPDFVTAYSPCKPCAQNCLLCSGPAANQCIKCAVNFIFENSTCIQSACKIGYFAATVDATAEVTATFSVKETNDTTNVKSAPTIDENTTTTTTTATTTVDPTILSTTSATGTIASSNTTKVNSTVCQSCHSSCLSCSGAEATNCTSCARGFYLSSGSCVGCTAGCYSCNSKDSCNDCALGLFGVKTPEGILTCLTACPAGWVPPPALNLTATQIAAQVAATLTSTVNVPPIQTACMVCSENCTVCPSFLILHAGKCVSTCPLGYKRTVVSATSNASTCVISGDLDAKLEWVNGTADGSVTVFSTVVLAIAHNINLNIETITFKWYLDETLNSKLVNNTDFFSDIDSSSARLVIPPKKLGPLAGNTLYIKVNVTSARGNRTFDWKTFIKKDAPTIQLTLSDQETRGGYGNNLTFKFQGIADSSDVDQRVIVLNEVSFAWYTANGLLNTTTSSEDIKNVSDKARPENFLENVFPCNETCSRSFSLPSSFDVDRTYYVAGLIRRGSQRVVIVTKVLVRVTKIDATSANSSVGSSVNGAAPKLNLPKIEGNLSTNTTDPTEKAQKMNDINTLLLSTRDTLKTPVQSATSAPASATPATATATNVGGSGTANAAAQGNPQSAAAQVSIQGQKCVPDTKCSGRGCYQTKAGNSEGRCLCPQGWLGLYCESTEADMKEKISFVKTITEGIKSAKPTNAEEAKTVVSTVTTVVTTAGLPVSADALKDIAQTLKDSAAVNKGDESTLAAVMKLQIKSRETAKMNTESVTTKSTTVGNVTTVADLTPEERTKLDAAEEEKRTKLRQMSLDMLKTANQIENDLTNSFAKNLKAGQSQEVSVEGLKAKVTKISFDGAVTASASASASTKADDNSKATGGRIKSATVNVELTNPEATNINKVGESVPAGAAEEAGTTGLSATVSVPQSITETVNNPDASFKVSAKANPLSDVMSSKDVLKTSAIYTIGFNSANGDEIKVNKLKEPIRICVPKPAITTTDSSKKVTFRLAYIDTTKTDITDYDYATVETEKTQSADGRVCGYLSHLSDYTVVATQDSANSAVFTPLPALTNFHS